MVSSKHGKKFNAVMKPIEASVLVTDIESKKILGRQEMRKNRTVLLLGASMATVAFASVANAQNEGSDTEYDDQIIVTGIRGGLERSADQKRKRIWAYRSRCC